MKGACGLLTFIVKADTIIQIEKFCESLQHIMIAVSWGGHESLIMPKCASIKTEDFDSGNKKHRMLRLYVGLEEVDYIIEDLDRGFKSFG